MIAEKLSYLKTKFHKTNQDIADATFLPIDKIKRIASGACSDPPYSYIESIADFFNVPTDFFKVSHSEYILNADEMEIARKYRMLDKQGKEDCKKAIANHIDRAVERQAQNECAKMRSALMNVISCMNLTQIEELFTIINK